MVSRKLHGFASFEPTRREIGRVLIYHIVVFLIIYHSKQQVGTGVNPSDGCPDGCHPHGKMVVREEHQRGMHPAKVSLGFEGAASTPAAHPYVLSPARTMSVCSIGAHPELARGTHSQ